MKASRTLSRISAVTPSCRFAFGHSRRSGQKAERLRYCNAVAQGRG